MCMGVSVPPSSGAPLERAPRAECVASCAALALPQLLLPPCPSRASRLRPRTPPTARAFARASLFRTACPTVFNRQSSPYQSVAVPVLRDHRCAPRRLRRRGPLAPLRRLRRRGPLSHPPSLGDQGLFVSPRRHSGGVASQFCPCLLTTLTTRSAFDETRSTQPKRGMLLVILVVFAGSELSLYPATSPCSGTSS